MIRSFGGKEKERQLLQNESTFCLRWQIWGNLDVDHCHHVKCIVGFFVFLNRLVLCHRSNHKEWWKFVTNVPSVFRWIAFMSRCLNLSCPNTIMWYDVRVDQIILRWSVLLEKNYYTFLIYFCCKSPIWVAGVQRHCQYNVKFWVHVMAGKKTSTQIFAQNISSHPCSLFSRHNQSTLTEFHLNKCFQKKCFLWTKKI